MPYNLGYIKTKLYGIKRGLYNFIGNTIAPLIRDCGLIMYYDKVENGIFTDQVGDSSRTSIPGEALVGNSATHADTTIIPNQNTALRVWGNFNDISVAQFMGSRLASGNTQFFMGVFNSSNYRIGFGTVQFTGGTPDTNKHKFELKNGEFFIDDIKIIGTFGEDIGVPSVGIAIQALNTNGGFGSECNFTLDACEIDHDGITYQLDITARQSNGIIPLNSSTGDIIQVQQQNSPAIPTIPSLQESLPDKNGLTVARARGVNLFNGELELGIYNGSTGEKASGSAFCRNIFPVLVKDDREYSLSSDNNYGWAVYEYDENMEFLDVTGGVVDNFTILDDTKYINFRTSISGQNDLSTQIQLNIGTTPLPYEPYQGYYFDQALSLPYQDGTPISGDNAWIDVNGVGVRIVPEFPRRIKYNSRQVDGVVDNGVDYENIEILQPGESANITINDNNITWLTNNVFLEVRNQRIENINKNSKQFLAVVNVINTDALTANSFALFIQGTGATIPFDVTSTGEKRVLIDGDLAIQWIEITPRSGLSNDENVTATYPIFYDVDSLPDPLNPLTSPLPTSQQWVSGNSKILDQQYDGITEFDSNRILTESDGTPILRPYDDEVNINRDQYIINFDTTKLGFFRTQLLNPCYTRVLEFFDLIVRLFDSNDNPLEDIDGNELFALKNGITRTPPS